MKNLLFIFSLIFLFSCSIQKRKYQKGFYVSSQKHTKHIQKDKTINSKTENIILKTISLPLTNNNYLEVSASADAKIGILTNHFYNKKNIEPDSLCDKITLKNGEEIKVNVLELTPALIKYKKCNEPESPLYIVKKSDVFKIKYSNGSQELMDEEVKKIPPATNNPNILNNDYKEQTKTHPLAIWAFVFSILGLIPFLGIFTSIRAIIYAARALKAIRLNPTEYKGDLLAYIALVLGIIGLAFLFLLIIALLGA
ncbi:MAG: DUF4190 domain-containing protein [Bacteroidota bacterium]